MKQWRRGTTVGWILFLVSWFLPVHKDGARIQDGVLPGVQAFMVAFSEDAGVLAGLSGLTNLLFLAPWVLPRRWDTPGLAWAFLGSAVVNATWMFRMDAWSELHPGYYAWMLSFLAMGLGLRRSPARTPILALT